MRKIILYIAASLDGHIARKEGEVDWLDKYSETGEDYGYADFYRSIDTTLMGNRTYRQVVGFGEFPSGDKKNYVFTRAADLPAAEYVEYVHHDIITFTKNLRNQSGSDIWLVGGSQIIELLLNHDVIDELILSIMPETLGSGIPLFSANAKPADLRFQGEKIFTSGVVQLTYTFDRAEGEKLRK